MFCGAYIGETPASFICFRDPAGDTPEVVALLSQDAKLWGSAGHVAWSLRAFQRILVLALGAFHI